MSENQTAKTVTYRPEVLWSVLRQVKDFGLPEIGDNRDHVARKIKRAPGFTIEHSECQPGDNNYVKAVVFHAPPGDEYRQHLFLVGFRSSDLTGPRIAKRRLDEIVLPWIKQRER